MPVGPGGEPDGPEDDRLRYFYAHVHVLGGWMTRLPLRAISILMALAADGPLTAGELDARLSARDETLWGSGLTSTAWEPLEEWTDAELRQWDECFDAAMAQHFPEYVPGGWQGTAEQANAKARQERADQIAQMDRVSAALGVAPVRTMADLLEFMVACTVLTASAQHGQRRYALNPQAPPPAEGLPPSGDDPAAGQARGRRPHQSAPQGTTGPSWPGDTGQDGVMRANLRALAHVLGIDTDAARGLLRYWLAFDWNPKIPLWLADPPSDTGQDPAAGRQP